MAEDTQSRPEGHVPADTDTLAKVQDWFWFSDEETAFWRDENKEAEKFRDGWQWEPDVEAELKAQKRPALTFNRIGPIIDAVVGLEIGNRQEAQVLPRGLGDVKKSEVLSMALEWLRDGGNAEDAESEAYRDMLTGGLGFTETTLEDGRQGAPVSTCHIEPGEVWWDPDCRKRNLTDARFVMRIKDVPYDQARAKFPPPEGETWSAVDYDAAWARMSREKWYKVREQRRELEPDRKGMVTLVACYWLDYAESGERVVMEAICGMQVLREGAHPVQGAGLPIKAISGKRDRDNNSYYGLCRAMKQPQQWANVWLSQFQHWTAHNTNAGILIEEDIDVGEDFLARYNKPGATFVPPGTVSGSKIMAKPQAGFPSGLRDLIQMAMDAPYTVTGINPELLGMVQREQAGVLEMTRKQASTGILAYYFESLRQYRRDHGEYLLRFLMEYGMEAIARVVDEEMIQIIPELQQLGTIEYDLKVDEAPSSPNAKERYWQVIGPMLQSFAKGLPPPLIAELMTYSPLPASAVEKMKQAFEQAGQPSPEQQQMAQLEMQERQAQTAKLAADAQLSQARAQKETVAAQLEPMKVQAQLQPPPVPGLTIEAPEPLAAEQKAADIQKKLAEARKIEVETALLPEKTRREHAAQAHQQAMDAARFGHDQQASQDRTRLEQMKLRQPRSNGNG